MAVQAVGSELELFEDFCSSLSVENGAGMVLEAWQRRALGDYFEGVIESLILVSKKNGKSTMMAALGLFHLMTTPDAECVVAATSRDQATIILNQCRGFVRRSPGLRERLRTTQREIVHPQLGGRVRVVAADTDTLDGWLGSLALLDEMHRAKSIELYSILREGIGPRDGRLITITTAGEDELSPLGQLRTRAYQLPDQHRDGAYRYARSGKRFAMHEWSLDNDQDADDIELVKEANPASWQTIARLRDRHGSPSMTAWQWRRFACGMWVRGEHSAIDPADWDACKGPLVIPDGVEVWVGWDQAWRGPDTTALVPVWWQSDQSRVVGDPVVFEAPESGMVDDRAIVEAFVGMTRRWRVRAVVFDPNAGAAALAQQIARDHGVTMVEHSQRDSSMALADGRLMEAVRRRQLSHTGHPVLRQHVLAAVEKPVAGDLFRFTRPKHGPRVPIDCLTALSMAHSTAVADAGRPAVDRSVYFF